MEKKSQSISSTQLVRSLPHVKESLEKGPVHVTSHGREDFVILSSSQYRELRSLVGMDVDRLDAKLRLTFDTIDELALVLDESLTIRRVNQAFCDVLEVDRETAVGISIDSLIETPHDQYIKLRLHEVLESRKAESFELPASHRGNRTYHYRIVPWPHGVAMFAKDISNRSRVRNGAVERAAFENSVARIKGFGTGVLNQVGKLASLSPSLANLLGGSPAALGDLSIFSVVDEESSKKIRKLLSGPHKKPQEIEIRYLRDGAKFKPANMILTQFQTVDNLLNYAFILYDPSPAD